MLIPFSVMKRRIIHDQHEIRRWSFATVVKELFVKVLKHSTVGQALVYAKEQNAILRVCRENLISLLTMEFGSLDMMYGKNSISVVCFAFDHS